MNRPASRSRCVRYPRRSIPSTRNLGSRFVLHLLLMKSDWRYRPFCVVSRLNGGFADIAEKRPHDFALLALMDTMGPYGPIRQPAAVRRRRSESA
jgi:hypothetical protein